MLTGGLIKAARALLGVDQQTLADASGVSLPTIKRLEPHLGPISTKASTEAALIAAFNAAGVVFIVEDGVGVGVRFQAPTHHRSNGGS